MSEPKCPTCGSSHLLGPTSLSVQGVQFQYPLVVMSFMSETRDPDRRPAITREGAAFPVGAASVCLDCGRVTLQVSDEVRATLRAKEEALTPVTPVSARK